MTDSNFQDVGVYIHWPFCISKCNYCNFNSFVKPVPENFFANYLRQLEWFIGYLSDKKLVTVYFGGGTPSLMQPSWVFKILEKIKQSVKIIDSNLEVTLEANPETVDLQKLIEFKDAGINRLSFGVQSFCDDWLFLMGRKNNRAKNIEVIQKVDSLFDNYSIDLIYSLPNQKTWEQELKESLEIASNAKHFSLYELSLEKGTQFWAKYGNANYENYTDTTHALMLDYGFEHYEISNYAKNASYSRHNMLYWSYKDYIGIGAGAHGRITINGLKNAFYGEMNIDKWINSDIKFTKLTNEEMAVEKLMMGLRTNLWCEIDPAIINEVRLKDCIKLGFLENDIANKIRTTFEGKKRLNRLVDEIIKDKIFT